MKKLNLLIGSFLLSFMLYGQSVEMVKEIIHQFSELQAVSYPTDNIDPSAASFAPLSNSLNVETYTTYLKDINQLFRLDDLNSSYTVIGDKEYPVNSMKLLLNYTTLPGFDNLQVWFELTQVTDSQGNNLLLSEEIIETYRQQGIIDDGFNFTMPGEASKTIWLNRELAWQENFTVKGALHIAYPKNYSLTIFTAEDQLKKQTVEAVEFQLVEIKDNMATYLVKGDRRIIESTRVVPLNKEDKSFLANSSMAIDSSYYDIATNTVKPLSDDEIKKSIEEFDFSNYNINQIKKIQVEGTITKLVLLYIKETAPIIQDFSVTMKYYQEY